MFYSDDFFKIILKPNELVSQFLDFNRFNRLFIIVHFHFWFKLKLKFYQNGQTITNERLFKR